MSIRVTLNCKVKPNQFEAMKPFLEKNLPNVRGYNGCLYVGIFLDENNNEMLLEEEWVSQDHHKSYINFIAENGVLNELASFLESPPDIKYFGRVIV